MQPDTTLSDRGLAQPDLVDGLNDLLQTDYDAVGAYEVAIDKLENRDLAMQVGGFRTDHERHIRDLNDLITSLGGRPKNEPHATGPFKQALQGLGSMGGDRGLLTAFRTNELASRAKYDGYARRANLESWPAEAKRIIDRNALDEERHYQWVADTMASMGLGSGEGAETGLVNRIREGLTGLVGGGSGGDADATGGPGFGERVADRLESGAMRLRDVADRQDSGASGARARVAGAAGPLASGMEGAARYLREGDPTALRTNVEESVRESPARSLVVAAAIGFVIGRILR